MLLSLLLHITLASSTPLRRVWEAPPRNASIVPHRLDEIFDEPITPSNTLRTSPFRRDSVYKSEYGATDIAKEHTPRSEFDGKDDDWSDFATIDTYLEDFDDSDDDQLVKRKKKPRPVEKPPTADKPYPVDEPGKPLKQRPDQLISPASGLPHKYFNMSNYRPWRPSHNDVRPKDRLDWRQPRDSAYCILGGVGKRQVFWQPQLVQDFFNLEHTHERPETNALFPEKTSRNKGHDFQYFFNTDSDTNITKAYSMFIVAQKAKKYSDNPQGNLMHSQYYQSPAEEKRIETCRRECASCWDAAQETGAEQFICSREKDEWWVKDDKGEGGYCRMAMVLGDAIGKFRICQIAARRLRVCHNPISPWLLEYYAQPGAVHNKKVSLICDSIRPCIPGACQVSNDTRLLAQGAGCRTYAVGIGGAITGMHTERWGLLGYKNLAEAMNDFSLQVYYQDFSTNATAVEKAWVLDSTVAWGPWKAKSEYGRWWTDYKPGDPIHKEWVEGIRYFPMGLWEYGGPVGFGSRPGGFDLKTDEWANALIANLSSIDGWQREHRPYTTGKRPGTPPVEHEPGEDDYTW